LQGKEITVEAYDGNVLWNTNFMTMKAEKKDAEATSNHKLNDQDFPEALLDYKSKGYTAEYLGKETKEGTECHRIKLTKKPIMVGGVKTDDISFYYFETENNLVIASETEIKEGPMKGQKAISTMSDYQEVDGLFFPFSMTQFGQPIKVKKITLNPVVDAKSFAFPVQ
jgi:outer membrane lipoprotein-sorting protein